MMERKRRMRWRGQWDEIEIDIGERERERRRKNNNQQSITKNKNRSKKKKRRRKKEELTCSKASAPPSTPSGMESKSSRSCLIDAGGEKGTGKGGDKASRITWFAILFVSCDAPTFKWEWDPCNAPILPLLFIPFSWSNIPFSLYSLLRLSFMFSCVNGKGAIGTDAGEQKNRGGKKQRSEWVRDGGETEKRKEGRNERKEGGNK